MITKASKARADADSIKTEDVSAGPAGLPKDFYYQAFDNAVDGLVICNHQSNEIIDANKSLSRLFSVNKDDLSGKKLWQVAPFTDIKAIEDCFYSLVKQETFHQEDIPIITKDKKILEIELTANVFKAQAQKFIIVSFHDITVRHMAQELVREKEYWFKESQSIGRIGSFVMDLRTNTWECSEVLNDIFGIKSDDPKTIVSWNALIHPDQKEEMLKYFLNDVLAQKKPFNKEFRIIRASDGAERWVWEHGELHLDAKGMPMRMIGTVQDITERKLAEKEISWRKEEENALEEQSAAKSARIIQLEQQLAKLKKGWII
ncbi:MAG: PAS domain S-box protein [Candidatus Falkowbacteria bacterium]